MSNINFEKNNLYNSQDISEKKNDIKILRKTNLTNNDEINNSPGTNSNFTTSNNSSKELEISQNLT